MKKEKYKSEIEILVKFSFYEKIKLKLCDLFSNDNSAFIKVSLFNLLIGALFLSFNPFLLIGNGVFFFLSLGILFYNRNKEKNKMLDNKLDECKEKCEINFSRMRTKFARIYKNTLLEAKIKFEEILSLSCIDLSKIEKKKWEYLKEEYFKIKKNITKLSMKKE